MANIESQVESLLKPIIENKLKYDLYDVIYAKEGKNYYLRVIIDKKDGIDILDCEKVNNAINDILDEADLIKDAYYLEVSSPGLERNLRKEKHFESNLGNRVNVTLFRPFNKKKEYLGILKKFEGNNLLLELENKEEIIFNMKDIVTVKTVFDFEGGFKENETD
ncbi:MAG: ribosome maturation factor RimP [Clostridia bacterium]|nr:ribosome maturation factor RimP [Clostridia bacterium]